VSAQSGLKEKCPKGCFRVALLGEEYEILKTVRNTVIKKSLENNEEPPKPDIDTIIRSLKN